MVFIDLRNIDYPFVVLATELNVSVSCA